MADEDEALESAVAGDDFVESDGDVLCRVDTESAPLAALLEGRAELTGERAAKLQKMEKLYECQVSRLEDILRSQEQTSQPILRPHDVIVRIKASAETIVAGQRPADRVLCKLKSCNEEAFGTSALCFEHITTDPRQEDYTSCQVCQRTVPKEEGFCGFHKMDVPKFATASTMK